MNLISKLYSILTRENKKGAIIFLILLVVATLFEILSISLIFPAISIILKADLPESLSFINNFLQYISDFTGLNYIIVGLSLLIFIFFIKNIFLIYYFWWKNGYSNEVQKQLSQRLFLTYLRKSYSFHLKRNSSELIRNLVTEVATFQKTFQATLEIIFESIVLISIIILIFIAEPKGSLVVFSIILFFCSLIYFISANKIKLWGKIRLDESNKYFKNVSQAIGSVRDIILTGRENVFLYNHYSQKSILTKIQQKFATISALPRFLFEFLAVFGILSLTIFFIFEGRSYESILPSLGLFAMAGYRLLPSVNRILISLQGFKYRYPSIVILADEIKSDTTEDGLVDNIFFVPKKVSEDQSKKFNDVFNDEIKIENLNYNYSNEKIKTLKNIDLKIKKGQSVGIFGPSGSGKSTLISLILGLLQPTSGKITIDGHDMKERLIPWQRNIGYVPQSVYLTDETIAQNIAFGISKDEINQNSIDRAIEAAQLKTFIDTLKNGIETVVGEKGVRLSGGQIQRIGIARALYHDPSVIFFDEATSSLDYETEEELMKDINRLKNEKTIIIIAHRLTTVEKCDFVIKIESGEIIDKGSPEIIFKKK